MAQATTPRYRQVFFKALVAMVTADAFDRHMRDRQYRAWAANEQQRAAVSRTALTRSARQIAPPYSAPKHDLRFPERPT
jgi:hypothetical protein